MLKDKFLPTIEVRASKYATVKEFQKYNTDIDILLDDAKQVDIDSEPVDI